LTRIVILDMKIYWQRRFTMIIMVSLSFSNYY
jgi:hypothetical protein